MMLHKLVIAFGIGMVFGSYAPTHYMMTALLGIIFVFVAFIFETTTPKESKA